MVMRSLRLLGAAFLLLVTAGIAGAHSEVVRSEPAADTTVTDAPQQVVITFSQLLDPTQSSVTVVDAAGATVSQGSSEVLANDNKVMRVALQPNLQAGTYTVRWQNLSVEDGEEASGSFTFTIGSASNQSASPAPSASATAAASASASPTAAAQLPDTGMPGSASLSIVLGLGALVLVVCGLAVSSSTHARRHTSLLHHEAGDSAQR